MKKIEIIKIKSKYYIPKYMTKGSSGLDIRACIKKDIIIKQNEIKLIPSGIYLYIKKKNITGIIVSRSGLAYKHGIILFNGIGIIDSDYQGEIMINLTNKKKTPFKIKNGYRIAQILFISILKIKFKIVNNFSKITKRSTQGFGHSGIK